MNLNKFKAKSEVVQMDQSNPKHKYRLGMEWIKNSSEEKDRGCWVTRSTVWPIKVCLQLKKPNVSRTASREAQTAGSDR